MLGVHNILDVGRPVYDMMERLVSLRTADSGGDYIERMWAEVKKNKYNIDSSFHGRDGCLHMVGQLVDIFVAGTETASGFMDWCILYLCHYEQLHDCLYEEIYRNFGVDRAISLGDNLRLPLLEATIQSHPEALPAGGPAASTCRPQ